jgi:hypothetical protein
MSHECRNRRIEDSRRRWRQVAHRSLNRPHRLG